MLDIVACDDHEMVAIYENGKLVVADDMDYLEPNTVSRILTTANYWSMTGNSYVNHIFANMAWPQELAEIQDELTPWPEKGDPIKLQVLEGLNL